MKQIRLMLLYSLLVVAGGCINNRIDLTDTGHLTVENLSPGKVKILWSSAYEEDGHFRICGVLKRRDYAAIPIPAHVHVQVMTNDDHIIQSLQTSRLYVPRNKIGHGSDWKRFEVRSTDIPLPGSRLLVTVHAHNESHTDEDLLSLPTRI